MLENVGIVYIYLAEIDAEEANRQAQEARLSLGWALPILWGMGLLPSPRAITPRPCNT